MSARQTKLIEECGQIFDLGTVRLRCVLRKGHKCPHRASLNAAPITPSDRPGDKEVTVR